jgi:hypothetical protein
VDGPVVFIHVASWRPADYPFGRRVSTSTERAFYYTPRAAVGRCGGAAGCSHGAPSGGRSSDPAALSWAFHRANASRRRRRRLRPALRPPSLGSDGSLCVARGPWRVVRGPSAVVWHVVGGASSVARRRWRVLPWPVVRGPSSLESAARRPPPKNSGLPATAVLNGNAMAILAAGRPACSSRAVGPCLGAVGPRLGAVGPCLGARRAPRWPPNRAGSGRGRAL